MPPTNKVNNVWQANTPSSVGEIVTLPSGQTCRARRVAIEDLVDMGILEHADSLTSLVDSKHVRKVRGGKGPDTTEVNLQSVLKDAGALRSMLTVMDKAIPTIVLDPPVALHYRPNDNGPGTVMLTQQERIEMREERPTLVFTDQIDLVDKMELFNWSMGNMGGLESFRGDEAENAVGTMADGPNVSSKAKRVRGARSR